MPDNDPLDDFLQSALATYADPGPGSGMESRILRFIATHRQPRSRPVLRWLAFAAAPALAAGILLVAFHHNARPGITVAKNPPAPQAEHPQTPAQISIATHPKPHRFVPSAQPPSIARTQPPGPPKLDVFPSPQPLTAQEQALLVVIRDTPAPELKALAVAQQQDAPPLAPIAVAHIPPLEPSAAGANDR